MTALGGKVIFGTLIIVVGIFLARIIAKLVGSGTGEGGFAQTLVRYAIIALFTAIGLTFMGLADQIVMLAFGLILGSAAVACALAFGLGGRDAAGADRSSAGRTKRPAADAAPPPPRRLRSAPPARKDEPAAAGVTMTWDEAVAFALTLPGTELSTSYGKPAVKVASTAAPSCSRATSRTRRSASRWISTRSRCSRRPIRAPSGRRRIMSAGRACWSATTARTRSGSAR